MIPKIIRILEQSENWKTEDLNETTIYIQFQLKDEIEMNQNLYNSNKDPKTAIESSGTEMKFEKKYLCSRVLLTAHTTYPSVKKYPTDV